MASQVGTKKKIFVGVSGGVDSSVALALLKEQNYDVTGVFLKVWDPAKEFNSLPCTWRDERRSAMRVCATLGVPFMTLDCEKEYKELVVDYMLSEYKSGRTPNPDVFCNKYIKFGTFLSKAMEAGADCIATGHYAQRIVFSHEALVNSGIKKKDYSLMPNAYCLIESADKDKDQSYFLHQLNQQQLAHTLFPIGHLQKSEVRKLARKFGLPTAEKKDSQGLCFIGKVDMKEFLAHYIKTEPGNVLNESGEVIGRHNGAIFYTIGERHGFVVSTPQTNADYTQMVAEGKTEKPRYYVVTKDITENTITISQPTLGVGFVGLNKNQKVIKIKDTHWIPGHEPDLNQTFDIRFRYRQEKQKCKILPKSHLGTLGYQIIPETAQIVAPGQSAVIYFGDICLGGGVIE